VSEFLPQFAAQAAIDLERSAKRLAGQQQLRFYVEALKAVVSMLKAGVHVVLPDCGEIYRSNNLGGEMPTLDECESFAGLPAPVTCFEYAWISNRGDPQHEDLIAPRRITIVNDGKQTHEGPKPDDSVYCATILSVIYNEQAKTWMLMDTDFAVGTPLVVQREFSSGGSKTWGAKGRIRNLVTGEELRMSEPKARKIAGEFHCDLNAVIQCCHALRAGASFEERTEPSASRRWKFEKRGVGGFTYHILKLPNRAMHSGVSGDGSHASPRLHVRRAHIRKLPTGVLTFVRQCLVGDPDKGVVEKHYEVQ
jgi:hypothetical protein